MHFKSLMHISFVCNNFEEMLDFYGNKLGLKRKVEVKYGTHNGYNHFALLVDDIESAYKEFKEKNIKITAPLSKGPSETWQFWAEDPDGNRFEVMQFTDKSYQVVGHKL